MLTTCQQCGSPFAAKRRSARFCGDRCRQEAHRGTGPLPALAVAPAGPVRGPQAVAGAVGAAEAEQMLSAVARRLVAAIAATDDPRELAVLAGKLPVVLRALRRPAATPATAPPSRLDLMRQARVEGDARHGWTS